MIIHAKEEKKHETETWIDIQTLEQRNDKLKEQHEYMVTMFCSSEKPDEPSYYSGCITYEDFEKRKDARLVKKYGNKYKPYL